MESNNIISSRLLALEEQVVEMKTSFERHFGRLFGELEKERAENAQLRSLLFQESQRTNGNPALGIEHAAFTEEKLSFPTLPETAFLKEARIASKEEDFGQDSEDLLAVLQKRNLEAEDHIAKLEKEVESSETIGDNLTVDRDKLEEAILRTRYPGDLWGMYRNPLSNRSTCVEGSKILGCMITDLVNITSSRPA